MLCTALVIQPLHIYYINRLQYTWIVNLFTAHHCIALCWISASLVVRISVKNDAFATLLEYKVGKKDAADNKQWKFTRDCVGNQS